MCANWLCDWLWFRVTSLFLSQSSQNAGMCFLPVRLSLSLRPSVYQLKHFHTPDIVIVVIRVRAGAA